MDWVSFCCPFLVTQPAFVGRQILLTRDREVGWTPLPLECCSGASQPAEPQAAAADAQAQVAELAAADTCVVLLVVVFSVQIVPVLVQYHWFMS